MKRSLHHLHPSSKAVVPRQISAGDLLLLVVGG
jgi:hypothetical protein